MWYSYFKTALRKSNLRVDLRVYPGDEEVQLTEMELPSKLKSLVSSSIIKGLDIVGIVSRFGIGLGMKAQQIANDQHIDIKVIPGQDYYSIDKFHAVFYKIKQNVPVGLPIQKAIENCKNQSGKVMLYDLTKRQAKIIKNWKGTIYAPNIVEIYNPKSKGYKDLSVDYFKVISTAARTGSELESIPVYSELTRKQLIDLGFLNDEEGTDYTPGYLGGNNG